MDQTYAKSPQAMQALELVRELQQTFAEELNAISRSLGGGDLEPVQWQRNAGANGGGVRLCSEGGPGFQRASVNVSQVHYDPDPSKKLGSATALSAIVHPRNPHAPSIHLHASWTEYKDGAGYLRIMADLNPSIPKQADVTHFGCGLQEEAPELFERACAEGDRYFAIPSLGRHRGAMHYYLEGYKTQDRSADLDLTRSIILRAIKSYGEIVRSNLGSHESPNELDFEEQLNYHTLYFFQVLTLDRGTTAGLLVHDQNDLGILGSLPAFVDPLLLAEWKPMVPAPQEQLVEALINTLGRERPAPVNDGEKVRLAEVLRRHYRAFPEALELQASAAVRPPSVENHR